MERHELMLECLKIASQPVKGIDYNYGVIVEMAEKMPNEKEGETLPEKIERQVKLLDEGRNNVYVFPECDGRMVPMYPHVKREKTLTPEQVLAKAKTLYAACIAADKIECVADFLLKFNNLDKEIRAEKAADTEAEKEQAEKHKSKVGKLIEWLDKSANGIGWISVFPTLPKSMQPEYLHYAKDILKDKPTDKAAQTESEKEQAEKRKAKMDKLIELLDKSPIMFKIPAGDKAHESEPELTAQRAYEIAEKNTNRDYDDFFDSVLNDISSVAQHGRKKTTHSIYEDFEHRAKAELEKRGYSVKVITPEPAPENEGITTRYISTCPYFEISWDKSVQADTEGTPDHKLKD